MNPRQQTIAALELRQPDAVPHFELEMQLTQEYFGDRFSTPAEWDAQTTVEGKRKLLIHDANLFVRTADHFSYGITFYSAVHRPTFDDYREGIRILREVDNGKRLLMAHGDVTPGIPEGRDMDTVIVDMMMHPEEVKARLQRETDGMIDRARQLKEDGLEGFILCSDYCFNSGPFLSPAMFSDLITPYLTRLIQAYRSMGLYAIKHTDGNIMPILDELLSAGPHALHSLDPMAGVDMRKVKELTAGRVCLIGNVNCALMQTGTDEDVVASCRYAMENGKPGGGYIFSTSNVIFKGMPKQRYDLMLRYYRENCRC
jgi:uroporphyrinogen decarboxylase